MISYKNKKNKKIFNLIKKKKIFNMIIIKEYKINFDLI